MTTCTHKFLTSYACSPYTFALNLPIKLLDEDGNVVVDEDGNPVTVTVSKNEDGSYSVTFGFVEGTDQATKDSFNTNGGRVIKTLIQVEKGRDVVNKATESKDNIHITVSPDEKVKETDKGTARTFGTTVITKRHKNEDGEITNLDLEVTIYEGTINNLTKNGSSGSKTLNEYKDNNLTQDQKVARTGAHELEHATNETDIEALKDRRRLTKKEHDVARSRGTGVAKEFGKLNKGKKDEQ